MRKLTASLLSVLVKTCCLAMLLTDVVHGAATAAQLTAAAKTSSAKKNITTYKDLHSDSKHEAEARQQGQQYCTGGGNSLLEEGGLLHGQFACTRAWLATLFNKDESLTQGYDALWEAMKKHPGSKSLKLFQGGLDQLGVLYREYERSLKAAAEPMIGLTASQGLRTERLAVSSHQPSSLPWYKRPIFKNKLHSNMCMGLGMAGLFCLTKGYVDRASLARFLFSFWTIAGGGACFGSASWAYSSFSAINKSAENAQLEASMQHMVDESTSIISRNLGTVRQDLENVRRENERQQIMNNMRAVIESMKSSAILTSNQRIDTRVGTLDRFVKAELPKITSKIADNHDLVIKALKESTDANTRNFTLLKTETQRGFDAMREDIQKMLNSAVEHTAATTVELLTQQKNRKVDASVGVTFSRDCCITKITPAITASSLSSAILGSTSSSLSTVSFESANLTPFLCMPDVDTKKKSEYGALYDDLIDLRNQLSGEEREKIDFPDALNQWKTCFTKDEGDLKKYRCLGALVKGSYGEPYFYQAGLQYGRSKRYMLPLNTAINRMIDAFKQGYLKEKASVKEYREILFPCRPSKDSEAIDLFPSRKGKSKLKKSAVAEPLPSEMSAVSSSKSLSYAELRDIGNLFGIGADGKESASTVSIQKSVLAGRAGCIDKDFGVLFMGEAPVRDAWGKYDERSIIERLNQKSEMVDRMPFKEFLAKCLKELDARSTKPLEYTLAALWNLYDHEENDDPPLEDAGGDDGAVCGAKKKKTGFTQARRPRRNGQLRWFSEGQTPRFDRRAIPYL